MAVLRMISPSALETSQQPLAGDPLPLQSSLMRHACRNLSVALRVRNIAGLLHSSLVKLRLLVLLLDLGTLKETRARYAVPLAEAGQVFVQLEGAGLELLRLLHVVVHLVDVLAPC